VQPGDEPPARSGLAGAAVARDEADAAHVAQVLEARGQFRELLATRPAKRHAEPLRGEPLPRRCARKDGFSLHAGIAVRGVPDALP